MYAPFLLPYYFAFIKIAIVFLHQLGEPFHFYYFNNLFLFKYQYIK